jgi:hypothetical protein
LPAVRRTRRRRWIILALVAGVVTAGVIGMYLRITEWSGERSLALASIAAEGGKYHEPIAPGTPWISRVIVTAVHGRRDHFKYEVFLNGPSFNDAWATEHKDLRSLPMRELLIANTRLSREAVLRLLGQNRLECFNAPGVPLTDEDAQRIGALEELTHLNLMQTQLTDAGLAKLKAGRLRNLNVAGTRVTSEALLKELAGVELQYLWLDGRQFTPELAAQLAQMKSLTMLALIGPDVTDSQLELLVPLQNVTYIRLEQTSVSEEAVAALRAARPAPAFVEVPKPDEVFAKWRDE